MLIVESPSARSLEVIVLKTVIFNSSGVKKRIVRDFIRIGVPAIPAGVQVDLNGNHFRSLAQFAENTGGTVLGNRSHHRTRNRKFERVVDVWNDSDHGGFAHRHV